MNHTMLMVAVALVSLGLMMTLGCTDSQQDPKNEKLEHIVPGHWPTDLVDAAAKINLRAARLSGQPPQASAQLADSQSVAEGTLAEDTTIVENQLRDIIGWVPEIAADTDLTEAQWLPIHQASQSLSKRLKTMRRPLDEATLGAIDDYCSQLIEAAKLLPQDSPQTSGADADLYRDSINVVEQLSDRDSAKPPEGQTQVLPGRGITNEQEPEVSQESQP